MSTIISPPPTCPTPPPRPPTHRLSRSPKRARATPSPTSPAPHTHTSSGPSRPSYTRRATPRDRRGEGKFVESGQGDRMAVTSPSWTSGGRTEHGWGSSGRENGRRREMSVPLVSCFLAIPMSHRKESELTKEGSSHKPFPRSPSHTLPLRQPLNPIRTSSLPQPMHPHRI